MVDMSDKHFFNLLTLSHLCLTHWSVVKDLTCYMHHYAYSKVDIFIEVEVASGSITMFKPTSHMLIKVIIHYLLILLFKVN